MQFLYLGPFATPTTNTTLIAVAGGFVWVGSSTTPPTIAKAPNGQSTALLSSSAAVSMCYLSDPSYPASVYIVDGVNNLVRYDMLSSTVQYQEHVLAAPTIPATPQPALTSVASGALGAATYYVQIAYVNSTGSGEITLSPQNSLLVTANHLLKVSSPASAAGVSTYRVYAGFSSTVLWYQSTLAIGVDWTQPSAGIGVGAAVPTGNQPGPCGLCCNWRGRLVLAGDPTSLQNFYMSRQLETLDWDYSQTDSAAAVAGNDGKLGQIGEPIIALIPFSNDYLKFGCSHSLWMAQGDPAAGGSIVNVSGALGIVGKDAWCVDPAGTLWFVASGGLFHVRPAWEFYKPPEAVSQLSVNQSFSSLNPTTTRVMLCYDPDLHYLHLFATPVIGTAGTHYTVDIREMAGGGAPGYWPQQFPSTVGPTAALTYYADGNPNNRTVLLGGQDGYIRAWSIDNPSLDDDGTAISASVTLGPFNPVPGMAATMNGLTIDMGELPVGASSTQWNCNVILVAGPEAYSVTEAQPNGQNPHPQPVVVLGLDRRQKTFRQRLRGGWFSISLQNLTDGKFFSFESGVMDFMPAGQNRLRR